MTADWTVCRVVRVPGGALWEQMIDHRARGQWALLGSFGATLTAAALTAALPGEIVPVLDADGLPTVTTVGDLTARHIGRLVRVETDRTLPHGERVLREIATASNKATRLTLEVPDHPEWFLMATFTLDTPCELLP